MRYSFPIKWQNLYFTSKIPLRLIKISTRKQNSITDNILNIRDKLNVTIKGATGAGKTYMACALINAAINKEIRFKYIRTPDLIYELS